MAPLGKAGGKVGEFRDYPNVWRRAALQDWASSPRPDLNAAWQLGPQLSQAIDHLIRVHDRGKRESDNIDFLG